MCGGIAESRNHIITSFVNIVNLNLGKNTPGYSLSLKMRVENFYTLKGVQPA